MCNRKFIDDYSLLFTHVTVHSVLSNIAKIHSRLPAAREFWLVCLGILAYSCQNTSRDSGVWTVTNCPFYILIDIHSSLFLSFLRWYRQNNDRSNYKQSSKKHLFFLVLFTFIVRLHISVIFPVCIIMDSEYLRISIICCNDTCQENKIPQRLSLSLRRFIALL